MTGVASGMSSTSSKTDVPGAREAREPRNPRTPRKPATARPNLRQARKAPEAAGSPLRPEGPELAETIAVGRVLRPHGLRGEVLVEVLSDVPDRLAPGRSLLLMRGGRPPVALVVEGCRAGAAGRRSGPRRAASAPSGGGERPAAVLLSFGGIGDRDAADALRGGWLEIERSQAEPAPRGTYYHYELLGCRCVQRGDDLGEVVEVVEDGGGVLLLVSDGSRQVPVPFVKRFLRGVDVAARRIEVELPPGLLEVCASRS